RDPPNERRRPPSAQAERRGGTTHPAKRPRCTSAPSIQVSCRLEIAEHSQYSCISRNEIDKKFVVLHRREPHWIPATIGPCAEPLTGESLALPSCHSDERSDEEPAFCRRRERSRFLAAL